MIPIPKGPKIDRPPATAEQQHILDLVKTTKSNIIINAFAGCGKTDTLERIQLTCGIVPILYVVFNKRNADEAEEKMLSTTRVKTLNGLGHGIWAQAIQHRKLILAKDKAREIVREIIDTLPKRDKDIAWVYFWDIVDAINMAKAVGYIPEAIFEHAKRLCTQADFHAKLDQEPDDIVSDLIDAALTASIKQAYEGRIDFNDQLYMSALFGGTFPRFPLNMVDEAQDLSPVNHEMVRKLSHGRLIAVGDPFQSIYGFRGAQMEGMSFMQERFSMVPCDLSISFRCPSAIVDNARWRVPQFTAFREGGHVEILKALRLDDIPDGATILCRNNAPLFRLALRLLTHKRSVSVAGSDVGPKIVAIMEKLGPDTMARDSVLHAIEGWREEKHAKGSKTADDIADCMKVFAEFGATLSQALLYARHLFTVQDGKVQLMTGHKAKGLEWDHVIHLDPWLIRQDEQDLNLRYVIQTRSKDKYFEVNSAQIT